MPLALSIQPCSVVLDMYGDPDTSSTFSLSGHVSVSLTPSSSLFVQRRETAHIVLQSLTVTFEGQSEVLSPSIGYAPIRLCSVTRELISGGPVDLSNEGHEDSDDSCFWNIIFDIPVPGWLPTTSTYGDADFLPSCGTSYALYATATFLDVSRGYSLFSITNICGPILSRVRTVDARRRSIILRRFAESFTEFCSNTSQMSAYTVDARRAPDSERSPSASIPDDILEKIQVIASIPMTTAVDEASLPFILRVRGNLNDSEGRRLRITEFFVDVEQVEVYRNNPSPKELDQCPIPSRSHQPPHVPLRSPHPIHTLYDTGFVDTLESRIRRSFSILSPGESRRYIISGDGRIFSRDQCSSSEDNWYILETEVKMLTAPYSHDWAGDRKRRITEHSPLFTVEHYVHVVICCEYDHPNSGVTMLERLNFSLPMKHVNVPQVPITSRDAMQNQHDLPCKQSLPAYSQLFHPDGKRKVDYSTPLPPYEPSVPSSP